MKCLQARVNHHAFQRDEGYVNSPRGNKDSLLAKVLRDNLKQDIAEFIKQHMKTEIQKLYATTSIKLYLLTEEEYNNLKGIA